MAIVQLKLVIAVTGPAEMKLPRSSSGHACARSGGRSVPSIVARAGDPSLGSLDDPPSAAALRAFGGIDTPPGLGLLPDLDKAGAATGRA
jgi:hypothetical protein